MAYGDFDLERARTELGLTVRTHTDPFGAIPPVPPDPAVVAQLARNRRLAFAINTEKARSELLIAPLLTEVWRLGGDSVAFFSGVPLNADPAAGLVGVCDYILGRPPQLNYVSAPVVVVVEAKKEDIMGGLGQCAAEMVGAQRFNRGRNPDIDTVYGCVSDGGEWKFLRLRGADLDIDLTEYLISEPDRILGLLLHFVGLSPAVPAA